MNKPEGSSTASTGDAHAAALPSDQQPTAAEPTAAEPTVAEPTVAEPTVAEPTVAEPTVAEQAVAEPKGPGPEQDSGQESGPVESSGLQESWWAVPGCEPPEPVRVSLVESGHRLAQGLTVVEEGVGVVAAAAAEVGGLSDEQVREGLVVVERLARRVEGIRLALVRASVGREPDGPGRGRATRAVLGEECLRDRGAVRADVRAAELVAERGVLRGLGAALAAGEVSPAHVDVARRVVGRLPGEIVDAHREQIDAVLTAHARRWSPRVCAGLADHLVDVVDPDRADR
ncbi:MAG: DUF222 domain-containing protein, partial [Actinomycetales bacterium]